ncbi:TPP-dependent indolepyruvate ferredoxin oxidoreductase alpha subunit [Fusobacterium sp. PH5-7]|uniref:hypothetical protein n=1 Tax=Fusobacterium sp. PH5-7 TaxID=2940528 RepID=UPI002475A77B|nr:hypothetical protein [Fusobacterium sp. PH5-7]MDH6459738.1 TPP-dependent indolepyruvate ferredoxin oxidoreductase alpha subunit [Fusobacterium sp. PH5-7]
MKKVVTMFLFLSCLTTALYSQEVSEKEGRKVLEQIRREIQAEEKAKLKAIEDAEKAKAEEEKARIAAEKAEEKKGKKILEDIRRDMNESLEEKVFRSDNNPEARIAAAGTAFEIGKERMAFLKMEEEEIVKLEEVLGMEPNENRVFLSQKFDEVYDEFNSNNNEIELLLLENEKLNEYLSRLDRMEQKVRAGN